MNCLHTIRDFLVRKYHPNIEADRTILLKMWESCRKGNRSVKEYHSERKGLEEQLASHDHQMPRFLVLDKLFSCGPKFELVKLSVETTTRQRYISYFEIMGEYVAYEELRGLHKAFRPGPDGRRSGNQGNLGAGNDGAASGNILVAQAKPDGKTYFHCGKLGHMEADCPSLSEEIKGHLCKQQKRRAEARKGRGSRHR